MILRFENFEIHPEERQLRVADAWVEVGARAFDLLLFMAQKPNVILGKQEIIEAIWPHVVVEQNNLQVQIHALRKVLGAHTIKTVSGRGYQLTATPLANQGFALSAEFGSETGSSKESRAESIQGNLVLQPEPIFGRQQEMDFLTQEIATRRLITILGEGGRGKSLLSQHVASVLRPHFQGGVWWFDLSSVQERKGLIDLIVQTVGLDLANVREPMDGLVDYMQSQSMLLVFDGCEHVIDAVAELIEKLLRFSTGLRVLATSQVQLRISAEWVFSLQALPIPEDNASKKALEFDAVRLLCERIQAQDRSVIIDEKNLQTMTAICRQLDGNALAIELAAARVPMLGLTGVLERLNERLELLTNGNRNSLSRHVSLLAALDWSHQLLSEPEAQMFRRLGVFKDGFSFEACQIYFGDEAPSDWTVMDVLNSLVERSMVAVQSTEPPRFRLLETNRTYALHQLALAKEREIWTRKHAYAMRKLCEQLSRARKDKLLWSEMNNIRMAFEWAVAQDDVSSHELAIALAVASAWLLSVAGQVSEALKRLLLVQPWVNDQISQELAARYWQYLARCGVRGRLSSYLCVGYFELAERHFVALGHGRHIHACKRMKAEALLDSQDLENAQLTLSQAQAMESPGWPITDRLRRMRIQALIEAARSDYKAALATAEFALAMAVADKVERYEATIQADIAGFHIGLGDYSKAVDVYDKLVVGLKDKYFQKLTLAHVIGGLVFALVQINKLDEAVKVCLDHVSLLRRSSIFMNFCDVFAWLLVRLEKPLIAARFNGAAQAFYERSGLHRESLVQRARDAALTAMVQPEQFEHIALWREEGARSSEGELASQLTSELEQFNNF